LGKSRWKIDRFQLGKIAFANESNLKKINQLLHPPVRRAIEERLREIQKSGPPAGEAGRHQRKIVASSATCRRGMVVLDVALLLESGLSELCDYLVFVDTSFKERWRRVRLNRKWSPAELRRRERFQMSLSAKRKQADFVIDNNGARGTLVPQVRKIFRVISR